MVRRLYLWQLPGYLQLLFYHGFVLGLMVVLWERYLLTSLEAKGVPAQQIRHYGFAFHGKEVLIGE